MIFVENAVKSTCKLWSDDDIKELQDFVKRANLGYVRYVGKSHCVIDTSKRYKAIQAGAIQADIAYALMK